MFVRGKQCIHSCLLFISFLTSDPNFKCNPNMQFQCPSGSPKCIMLQDKCNQIVDCPGEEDESGCLGK